jgi:hypothetical protein
MYLYLAAVQWLGLQGVGLGWYRLFVAVNAVLYAPMVHDIRLSAMWLAWASLWFFSLSLLGCSVMCVAWGLTPLLSAL